MTFYAEGLWRDRDRRITNFVRGRDAPLGLTSVDLAVAMSELYEGIDVAIGTET